jgi:O-antigen ligase/tetratricopeptide (TPR) repeat protein
VLQSIVDAALCGMILLAPYVMGGRHAVGHLVYVILPGIMALAWWARLCVLRHKPWTFSAVEWLLMSGGLLVVVQIVPWPVSWLHVISPKLEVTLPVWTANAARGAPLGVWNQVSLTPAETRGALALYLAYGLLFVVVIQRMRRMSDLHHVLKLIAASAVGMSVCGLLQYVFSNGKFLWVYQHPFRDTHACVLGPFINHNHFAHFLALGVGPLVFWWMIGNRTVPHAALPRRATRGLELPWQRLLAYAPPAGICLVFLAGLLSLSRGGAVALLVATGVCGAIYYRNSLLRTSDVTAAVAMAALVLFALVIHGYDRVANRLDDLTSGSIDALDGTSARRSVWAANLAAIRDYPILGTGIGSHREVHPMYRHESRPVEFTHAENGYVQVAAEAGLAGLLLVSAGMAYCARWCLGALRRASTPGHIAAAGAVSASLVASAVHSLFDFVWYIPACITLTVILAACAFRLWQWTLSEDDPGRIEWKLSPPYCQAATVCVALVFVWMISTHWGPARAAYPWDAYLRGSDAAARLRLERIERLAYGTSAAADASIDHELAVRRDGMILELQRVLSRNPCHARAHVRLASLLVERFHATEPTVENAMELSQIRDAAIQSQFRSRAELDAWLSRAFGSRVEWLRRAMDHALEGLRLCPLQGDAYMQLGELCFLRWAKADAKVALMDQALRVRPRDGNVLFAAGKEAALAGNLAGAVGHWKACFHCGDADQKDRIMLLAGALPVSFFLEQFQPGLLDLQRLYFYYKAHGRTDELPRLCDRYLSLADSETRDGDAARAADAWLFAWRLCRELERTPQARRCAENAFKLDANRYQIRYALAVSLLENGAPGDAEEHVKWCLMRKPDDRGLQTLLESAVRERVAQQSSMARDVTVRD